MIHALKALAWNGKTTSIKNVFIEQDNLPLTQTHFIPKNSCIPGVKPHFPASGRSRVNTSSKSFQGGKVTGREAVGKRQVKLFAWSFCWSASCNKNLVWFIIDIFTNYPVSLENEVLEKQKIKLKKRWKKIWIIFISGYYDLQYPGVDTRDAVKLEFRWSWSLVLA